MGKIDAQLVEQWKNMPRNKEASDFYDQNIFPAVKDVFISKHRPEKQYEGLILTVGFSPEPLILSIHAIQPTRIGLLYTPETKGLLWRIQDDTASICNNVDLCEIDGTNPNGIYETIWELRFSENWQEFENIAVDITGGKNSMAAGAALAAAVIPADIYYVDTSNYLPELRVPEPGSEYLKRLESPFESSAYKSWSTSLINPVP